MSWLTSPLLAVDTESTGTNPESDRIVTLAIGRSAGPGDWTLIEDSLINPGMPIPPDATRVHGITDEQAAQGADPAEVLSSVLDILTQAAERRVPIVAHNVPYDATLIDRELRRHLGHGLPDGLLWLDTLVLFRRFDLTTGSRTLESLAHRHGITFPAHNAAADALASLRLLHILAGDNDLLPLVPVSYLQERQRAWSEAQQLAAEYRRRGNGHAPQPIETGWPVRPLLKERETES